MGKSLIFNEDNLKVLSQAKVESVDLILTSPPYDNLRTYAGTNEWTFDAFKKTAKALFTVLKKGGVIVWVVSDATHKGSETGSSFKQALYFKHIGLNLHDTMIYQSEKPPLTHNRYEQKFEYMFILSKGSPKTFNPIMLPCKYAGANNSLSFRHDGDKLEKAHTKGKVKDTKIKGNVWFYDTGKHKTTKYLKAHEHPAIFPDKLAEDHILSWSNEGDTVLDPFMGSGTTGEQALRLGRKFVGIEVHRPYFDIAKERINRAITPKNKGVTKWT
jgi:DNA modification methylase